MGDPDHEEISWRYWLDHSRLWMSHSGGWLHCVGNGKRMAMISERGPNTIWSVS